MQFPTLVTLLVPALTLVSAGFLDQCQKSSLSYTVLQSQCKGDKIASVELNNMMHNERGNLRWGGTGFQSSCNSCSLNYAKMTCTCHNGEVENPWNRSTIDLQEHIFYDGNNLVYI